MDLQICSTLAATCRGLPSNFAVIHGFYETLFCAACRLFIFALEKQTPNKRLHPRRHPTSPTFSTGLHRFIASAKMQSLYGPRQEGSRVFAILLPGEGISSGWVCGELQITLLQAASL